MWLYFHVHVRGRVAMLCKNAYVMGMQDLETGKRAAEKWDN